LSNTIYDVLAAEWGCTQRQAKKLVYQAAFGIIQGSLREMVLKALVRHHTTEVPHTWRGQRQETGS
jgi:uncharacterized protein YfeS